METQQHISSKKVILHKKDWKYYVFFKQSIKISKSGPWSEQIACLLRNELLVNNICAWVKYLDEDIE